MTLSNKQVFFALTNNFHFRYEGGFSVPLIAKDLGLAEAAALSCGTPLMLGALAHQIYRALILNGYGDKDFAVVYEFLKGQKK